MTASLAAFLLSWLLSLDANLDERDFEGNVVDNMRAEMNKVATRSRCGPWCCACCTDQPVYGIVYSATFFFTVACLAAAVIILLSLEAAKKNPSAFAIFMYIFESF